MTKIRYPVYLQPLPATAAPSSTLCWIPQIRGFRGEGKKLYIEQL